MTFENALTKVASVIGWGPVARIVGFAENTVRNWSDPDTTAKMTLEAAFRLDVEFHTAGGHGAPFLDCYTRRVETGRFEASPELQALIAGAAKTAKETGEAIEATLNAATPSAGLADISIAERELEDATAALQNSLALIRARKKALLEPQGNKESEPPARALEVARPPTVTA